MEKEYCVLSGDASIGTACVKRCGLYYHIRCRCDLTGSAKYKVVLSCGDKQESLGLCVPVDGRFGLETHVPIKRIGEGEFTFRAVPKHAELQDRFEPVSEHEPFHYIARLGNAYLARRNDIVGVDFRE